MRNDPELLAALDEYEEDRALDAEEARIEEERRQEDADWTALHDAEMDRLEEGAYIAGVLLDGEPAPDPWEDLYRDFESTCPDCGAPAP